MIVTHFIYWNGKNVAFPFFFLPSLSSLYYPLYILPLSSFSLHFSLVSSYFFPLHFLSPNFFFLSSSRSSRFSSLFPFFSLLFSSLPRVSTTRVPPYVHPFFLPSFRPSSFHSPVPLEFLSLNAKRAFEIFLHGWNDCARRNPINALHCSYEPRLIARGNPDQKGYL